jgi:hypothetical protein
MGASASSAARRRRAPSRGGAGAPADDLSGEHSGLLVRWEPTDPHSGTGRWVQCFGVLTDGKLHLFSSEADAQAWATPLSVWALPYCRVTRDGGGDGRGAAPPPDSIVVEAPETPDRLDAQNGAAVLRLRAFDEAEEDATALWLRRLQVASRAPWQRDSAAYQCPGCASTFDVLNRRHHCRRCGGVFCDPCCAWLKALPELAYPQPVRVCRRCFSAGGPVQPPADGPPLKAAAAASAAAGAATDAAAPGGGDARPQLAV